MNKDKVIRLLKSVDSGLNDIKDNQEPVMQALTEYVRSDVKDLKKEINSKSVMPKCFDDWYQIKVGEDESTYSAIESLNREVTIHGIGYATILGTWISNDIDSRYQRCVEAILYGYEVSDDE